MQNITILDPAFYTIFPYMPGKIRYTSWAALFASICGMPGIDFGKEYALAMGIVKCRKIWGFKYISLGLSSDLIFHF